MKLKNAKSLAGTEVLSPEELWRQSGLSREEWNAEMERRMKEAEERKPGSGFGYALMMITKDGRSVMTKLAEAGAKAVLESARERAGELEEKLKRGEAGD